MKKLITTMVLMLALLIVGKAQTPLLSEGFEGGSIPDTWTVLDEDGDGLTWLVNGTQESATAHQGSKYVYSRSWSSSHDPQELTPDNWLITPLVNIPSTGNYDLTYWVCAMQDDFPQDHYGIWISTGDDPEDVDSYESIFEETLDYTHGGQPAQTQGYWQKVTIHLTGISGNVYIAFRHYDCSDNVAICFDDIKIDVASTDPELTVGETTLQFGTGSVGDNFGRKQFSVSGANLTNNVTITLPTGTPFGISTDTSNFSNTATLTPNASHIVNGTIYVSFNPTTTGFFEVPITITSDAPTVSVNVRALSMDCSQSQTIPWYEDFSNGTRTTFNPTCWTVVSTDTADYVNSSGTVYPGYKYYTWCSTGSPYATVIGDENHVQDEHLYTPTFDLSNVTGARDFQFNFTTHPENEAFVNNFVRFYVNMSVDGGATYTTVWNAHDNIDKIAEIFTSWSSYLPVHINMDDCTSNSVKFEFVYEGDSGYVAQMIIQDAEFTNYFDPRLAISADDTINFFTYIGHPDTKVIPVEGRNLTEAINVSTTAPFEISANGNDFETTATLPANGGNLYVRYNPNVNSSDSAIVTITSHFSDTTNTYPDTTFSLSFAVIGNSYDCSVVTLPISESFESEEGTVLAPNATEYCWSAIKFNTTDAQNDIINSNDYAYDGNLSLRFSSAKFNAQQIYDQYLITPELTSENPMLVMFNYANSSALKDETFAVGYSTTGNAFEDFEWEDDITNTANTDWQLYRNTNVPANVKYVAIHYKSQRKAYLYIDKFQIMEVPSCLFPVNLKVENTDTTHANIAWTAGGDEESWQVVYGVAPLIVETATPTTVNNTSSTTLSGLTANTHYQVAVRAICTEGNSSWSEIIDFWTTSTPAMVPYTQTFEDNDADRENWVRVNGDQPNYFIYGKINAVDKALMITNDGTQNLYGLGGEDFTSHYSTVWAYRDLQFPETTAASFKVTVKWKCAGEVDYDFGEMFIGNATEVTNFSRNENVQGYVDVNTAHYIPAGLTKVARFVNQSQLQTRSYLIPAEDVAGQVKRLYILWTNDSLSGGEPPLAIDEIIIATPIISNLTGTVKDATDQTPISGATISMVSTEGFTASTTTDNDGNYTINNLVTDYYEITVSANGYQTLITGYGLGEGNNNFDMTLTKEPCSIIPTGVEYTIEEDNLILTWDAIESGVMTQALSEDYYTALGFGEGSYSLDIYHMFRPSDLNSYNGCTISSIGFYTFGALEYCTYTLRIWVGGSMENGPASPAPVYEQEVLPDDIEQLNQWNDITLTTPYVINGSQTLWIGFNVKVENAPDDCYPLPLSRGNNVGYGNILYMSGRWRLLSELNNGAYSNYCWMIHANVVAPELTYNILEDDEVIAYNVTGAEYTINPFNENYCYQVQTICENGMVSSRSECASEVGINDVDGNASFEVYPNPAHETVTVSTTMNAQKVEILNYLGQVIYSHNVNSNNFTLNVANYADGVYFIRLTGDEGIATQKLIKQ